MRVSLATSSFLVLQHSAARDSYLLDDAWKFYDVGYTPPEECAHPEAFTIDLNDQQCFGLAQAPAANSETDCENACCADAQCEAYQWCDTDGVCSDQGACWIGKKDSCGPGKGWKSKARTIAPECSHPEDFSIDLNDQQCLGLANEPMSHSEAECKNACCADTQCEVYQWCDTDGECDDKGLCWIGKKDSCGPGKGWKSYAREISPDPGPGGDCNEPECQPDFDDADWRQVDVPHDFVVEHNFSKSAVMSSGYLPYSVGWYRKEISFPEDAKGQAMWLDFDGTQAHSAVYLDGKILGGHVSGYTPYRFQLDADALAGKTATLAVKIDATQPDGWWYDGGGIYRHVWLSVASKVRVAGGVYSEGVYAPAVVTGAIAGGNADAELTPSVEVVNEGTAPAEAKIFFEVTDATGQKVASSSVSVTIPASETSNVTVPAMALRQASLWSVDSPSLYSLQTRVQVMGEDVDVVQTTFGVRKIFFDAQKGFFLNDVPTKIMGQCNHQDFAGIGVAIPDSLQSYRISKLKKMGSNAWRTAHNMPTKALLDAADRLGFLVWDENHRNGQPEEAEILVKRDRNHPSVIIWSICNEVLCAGSTEQASEIKNVFHTNDPLMGRPVSANNNGWNGADTVLDLQGFDYSTGSYDDWHKRAPNIPAISSETSSAVSDRGEYFNDATGGHVRGYDTEAPSWAQTAEYAWNGIEDRSFIAGGFTWTGFDYKGEPTPYSWPDVNSHFGILDIAGFEKDRWYWYQANWLQPEVPVLHVFPHWNWATARHAGEHLLACSGPCSEDENGPTVEVWAFSNADEVELLVNNVSQGRVPCGPKSHAAWQISYEPGTLEARAYKAGSDEVLNTAQVVTTGEPTSLRASIRDGVGDKGIAADNSDVALVQVEIMDQDGRVVPTAVNDVTFEVTGAGKLIGTGNGDPASHTPDKSATREAYHGLLLGVVQSAHQAGTIKVTATSAGLVSSTVEIKTREPARGVKRLPAKQELLV